MPEKSARTYERHARFETLETRLVLSVQLDGGLAPPPDDSPGAGSAGTEVTPPVLGAVPRAAQIVLLSDYGNLPDALTAIGAAPADLIIDVVYQLNTHVEVPSNINLSISGTGKLVYGSWQLTINGAFDSVSGGLAGSTGSVVFEAGSVTSLRARWWSGSDTEIIEEALRAASLSDVKRVLLEGEFTIDHTIRIESAVYSGITVAGEGQSTVLRVNGSTDGVLVFYVGGVDARIDDITFENFALDGNHAARSQGIYTRHGTASNGLFGIELRSLTARNFDKTGFYLGGNIEGSDLLSYDNAKGFVARDGLVVLDDIVARNNDLGIDIAGGRPGFTTDARISNFVMEDNGNFGAKTALGENGTTIHAHFTDGFFRNNADHGFAFTFPDEVTDFSGITTTLTNVQAIGNGSTGLGLKVGKSVLQNVTANGNAGYGILVGGATAVGQNVTASDNTLTGIMAWNGLELVDVVATGNGREGIRLYDTGTLTNGTIANNGSFGVRAYGATATLQLIDVPSGSGPQQTGVGAWEGSSLLLTGMPGTQTYADSTSSITEDIPVQRHAANQEPMGADGAAWVRTQFGDEVRSEHSAASLEVLQTNDIDVPHTQTPATSVEEASRVGPDANADDVTDAEIDAFWDREGDFEYNHRLTPALEDVLGPADGTPE